MVKPKVKLFLFGLQRRNSGARRTIKSCSWRSSGRTWSRRNWARLGSPNTLCQHNNPQGATACLCPKAAFSSLSNFMRVNPRARRCAISSITRLPRSRRRGAAWSRCAEIYRSVQNKSSIGAFPFLAFQTWNASKTLFIVDADYTPFHATYK